MELKEEQKMEDRGSKYVKEVLVPSGTECRDSTVPARSSCSVEDGSSMPIAIGEREGTGCPTTAEQGVMRTRGSRRYSTLLTDKTSHKRRTLQDMTKPLKTWLYENSDNPYPTKKAKATLAMASEMTLVQVSNWFANARRRLKNTVRQPCLTWSKRIKLCNMYALDNTHGFGVDSSLSDKLEVYTKVEVDNSALLHPLNAAPPAPFVESCRSNNHESPSTLVDEEVMYPHFRHPTPLDGYSETANLHKFKQSLLHRYLNDSIQHQRSECQPRTRQRANERPPPPVRLNESGSLTTHDYEDVSCSPNSTERDGDQSVFRDGCAIYDEYIPYHHSLVPNSLTIEGGKTIYHTNDAEETYCKEITAALVLTNMAQAKRHQRLL